MRTSGVAPFKPPTQYTDIEVSTANPISGTPYGLIGTTLDMRIIGISVRVTWTVQPTPLEVHVLIDGVTFIFARANPVSNTWYVVRHHDMRYNEANQTLSGTAETQMPFVLEGRSIIISTETTGGTVSNMTARLRYALYR